MEEPRYTPDQLAALRTLESALGVRTGPEDLIRQICVLQEDLVLFKNRIKGYDFRGKFSVTEEGKPCLNNYYKLGERIYEFYKFMKTIPEEIKKEYADNVFTVYRAVQPGVGYNVREWKAGDVLAQVVPMSSSLYLDTPIYWLDEQEYAILKVNIKVDENFGMVCTSNSVDTLDKETARNFAESGEAYDFTQSEVTLPPGEITVRSMIEYTNPITEKKLAIFEVDYRIYSYDEWEKEYAEYAGCPVDEGIE